MHKIRRCSICYMECIKIRSASSFSASLFEFDLCVLIDVQTWLHVKEEEKKLTSNFNRLVHHLLRTPIF